MHHVHKFVTIIAKENSETLWNFNLHIYIYMYMYSEYKKYTRKEVLLKYLNV